MKFRLGRRSSQDLDDQGAGGVESGPADAAFEVRQARSARVFGVALLVALACAPIALVVAVVGVWSSAPAPVARASGSDWAGEQAEAGEFATRVVVALLTSTSSDRDAVDALVPADLEVEVGKEALVVADPQVAGVESAGGGGRWVVTVAVTVDEPAGRVRRYFEVPTRSTDGVMTLTALPAVVAAPAVGEGSGVDYPIDVDARGAVGSSVSKAFEAYLTGGDVSRYVAPGFDLRAPVPAPFTSVEVRDVAAAATDVDVAADPARDDLTVEVLVGVVGQVAKGTSLHVSYAVSLRSRDGRWEISSFDQSPVLTPAGDGAR